MKISFLGYSIAIQKNKPKPLYKIGGRRSGASTRLVDQHLQTLFNTGKVAVFDHYMGRQATARVFHVLLRRLAAEHNITDKHLDVNSSKFVIRIKDAANKH